MHTLIYREAGQVKIDALIKGEIVETWTVKDGPHKDGEYSMSFCYVTDKDGKFSRLYLRDEETEQVHACRAP